MRKNIGPEDVERILKSSRLPFPREATEREDYLYLLLTLFQRVMSDPQLPTRDVRLRQKNYQFLQSVAEAACRAVEMLLRTQEHAMKVGIEFQDDGITVTVSTASEERDTHENGPA